MSSLASNLTDNTSAGEWTQNLDYKVLHSSLITEIKGFTTTTLFLQELALAENERITGSGIVERNLLDLNTSTLLQELRKISGLTWKQIASLFGVSSRALHFWNSGNTMTATNQEKLGRFLGAIRSFDTGSPTENRRLLLTTVKGILPLDLLRNGAYEDFIKIKNYFSQREKRPVISEAQIAAKSPLSPDILAQAKQDRIHEEKRKARSVKVKRSKKV